MFGVIKKLKRKKKLFIKKKKEKTFKKTKS